MISFLLHSQFYSELLPVNKISLGLHVQPVMEAHPVGDSPNQVPGALGAGAQVQGQQRQVLAQNHLQEEAKVKRDSNLDR